MSSCMQHSESTPHLEIKPSSRAHLDHAPLVRGVLARLQASALWYALAVAAAGLFVALTYALANLITTSWVFVN